MLSQASIYWPEAPSVELWQFALKILFGCGIYLTDHLCWIAIRARFWPLVMIIWLMKNLTTLMTFLLLLLVKMCVFVLRLLSKTQNQRI